MPDKVSVKLIQDVHNVGEAGKKAEVYVTEARELVLQGLAEGKIEDYASDTEEKAGVFSEYKTYVEDTSSKSKSSK